MFDQFEVSFTHLLLFGRFSFKTAPSTLTYLWNPVRSNDLIPLLGFQLFNFLPPQDWEKQAVDESHRLYMFPSSIRSLPLYREGLR
jgi:hypothetical protein